jgi:NAD(P)-dependent dehydrogenase (short-subunit alcohol dehydrogenase family)
VAADLSSAGGCENLVRAEPRSGILVNNLGIFEPKPFFDTPDELGAIVPCQRHVRRPSFARLCASHDGQRLGTRGFLSSEAGINVPVDSLHYGVTKAAVFALSRGLAKLAHRSGVTVNAVLPGVTMSEWVEAMIRGRSAFTRWRRSLT